MLSIVRAANYPSSSTILTTVAAGRPSCINNSQTSLTNTHLGRFQPPSMSQKWRQILRLPLTTWKNQDKTVLNRHEETEIRERKPRTSSLRMWLCQSWTQHRRHRPTKDTTGQPKRWISLEATTVMRWKSSPITPNYETVHNQSILKTKIWATLSSSNKWDCKMESQIKDWRAVTQKYWIQIAPWPTWTSHLNTQSAHPPTSTPFRSRCLPEWDP